MGINNDIYYVSAYTFFDTGTAFKHSEFLSQYVNSGELSEYMNGLQDNPKISMQVLPVSYNTLESLKSRNLNIESNLRYSVNPYGNYVIAPLPDLFQMGIDETGTFTREQFNLNNKHKLYKVIGMNGSSRYSVFTATVSIDPNWKLESGERPNFQIKYINNTKTDFLIENDENISRVRASNGKVTGRVLAETSNGYMKYQNADYGAILKEVIEHNIGIANDVELYRNDKNINNIATILDQTNEPISLINFHNAYSRRGSFGVAPNSYRNSTISYGYLSGAELSDMLNASGSNKGLINNDYTYRLKFSLSDDDVSIKEIVPIDNKGNEVTDFIENIGGSKTRKVSGFQNTNSYKFITSYENRKYFRRDRAMFKMAHLDSKLSSYLTGEDVQKYNEEIIDLFNNKKMTREESYRIANNLVTEYQTRLLDAYGFSENGYVDTSNYIESFYQLFHSINPEERSQELNGLYDAVFNHFDAGMIAGNIYEGRLFDNLLTIGTQNQTIMNKKHTFSRAFPFALYYENSDTQRKGQSGSAISKMLLEANGETYDVSRIMSEMFSSVDEMKYKQTKFVNEQANAMVQQLGSVIGYGGKHIPNINSHNYIRALYGYTGDFAFQEGSMYTTSAMMQSISMYDSKKPFLLPFNVINREAFGDLDDQKIKDFYKALSDAKYNVELLSTENQFIFNNMMKNVLGSENYEKMVRGVYNGEEIIDDIKELQKHINGISSLNQDKEKSIIALNKITKGVNEWIDNNFIRTNNTSEANLLNPEMVNSNFSNKVKGSNFIGFKNFEITPQGIKFNLLHGMIGGHGSKTMNDNIKSTVGATTHLLSVEKDGHNVFIEAIINDKSASSKRNFTGTEIARTLTTAALNSINADYGNNPNLTKAQKFEMFKKSMSGALPTKSGLTNVSEFNNIFDILNIDMTYDSATDTIHFVDHNIDGALKYYNALDSKSFESIDAKIIDNVRKHRKKIFGKEFITDEGKILSAFIDTLIEHNYDNLLNQMTEDSYYNYSIYLDGKYNVNKSYYKNDNELGMTALGEFSGGKLLYTDIMLMHESKNQKNVHGLKLGRLSALTFTELGMDNMMEYLQAKSTSEENINTIIDFFALAAQRGTDFARGSDKNYFYTTFQDNGHTISLNDLDDIPYSHLNNKATTFLANSPLGRLMKYNFDKDKLEKPVKGLINDFDKTYMDILKNFFSEKSSKSVLNTLGGTSKLSILDTEFSELISIVSELNKNGSAELQNKLAEYKLLDADSVIKTISNIKGKLSDIVTSRPDTTLQNSLNSFREMIGLLSNDPTKISLTEEFLKYKHSLYEELLKNKSLTKHERKVLDFVFSVMGNKNNFSENSFNIYKTMMSISNMYQIATFGDHNDIFFGIEDHDLKNKLRNKLYDFTLNKRQQHEFYSKYLNIDYNKKTKKLPNNPLTILKSFFYNFESIEGEGIFSILDLQQIGTYGDIGFMIDSFHIDQNGDMIPNPEISAYERIMNANTAIRRIQEQRKKIVSTIDAYKKQSNINSDVSNHIDNAFDVFNKKYSNFYDDDRLSDMYNSVSSIYKNKFFYNSKLNYIPDEILFDILFNSEYEKNSPLQIVKNEINNKLMRFKSQLTQDKIVDATSLSAMEYQKINVKHLKELDINNLDLSDFSITQEQYNILKNSFGEGNFFDLRRFYFETATSYGLYSKSPDDEQIYKSVVEIDEYIKKVIVDTFRDKLQQSSKLFKEDYKTLNNMALPYNEKIKVIGSILGLTDGREEAPLYAYVLNKIVSDESILDKYDEQVVDKIMHLTSSLMTREKFRAERLYSKGGPLYDMISTTVKDSAMFSPREASGITSFIENEAKDILKKRVLGKDGRFIETQQFKDFKSALRLIYGESVVDEQILQFQKLYDDVNLDNNLAIKTISEIKRKLDLYSGIVIGTTSDWEKMGKSHLFANGSNVYKGFLSRHPHQYKFSVSPNRLIRLNDISRNLSFIGKYLGSEEVIKTSQNSLMFVGKLTAMFANGDFDGDVFQIMSLGERSLDASDLKKMTSTRFLKELDMKTQLFYLLRNTAGEDLKSIFEQERYDWNLYNRYHYLNNLGYRNNTVEAELNVLSPMYQSMEGKKYAEIRQLILDIYTKKQDDKYYFGDLETKKIKGVVHYYDKTNKTWNVLDSNTIYKRIEQDYLSMSNEFFRVNKKLEKEIESHRLIHTIKGFYGTDNSRISKKTLATFLATLDNEYRNDMVIGNLDIERMTQAILQNNVLKQHMKDELIRSLVSDEGVTLFNAITKDIKEDGNLTSIITVANEVNTYLNNSGQAKSGEVHDKLTKYRSMVDMLLHKDSMNDLMTYLDAANVTYDKDMYDVNNLRALNLGHNIGTLIEELSISAKKGNNISPDRIIDGFNTGEHLIRESDLFFDIKKMKNLLTNLQQEKNAYYTSQQGINKVADEFVRTVIKKLENKTIYEFFEDMFKNENVEGFSSNKNSVNSFHELMKTYLQIFTELSDEEIDKYLSVDKVKKIKVSEVFKGYEESDFIRDLSTWGQIMFKGSVERDTGVLDFDTAPVFGIVFKKNKTYNFLKRTADFLKFIGLKGYGTRIEGKLLSWLDNKQIQEFVDSRRKTFNEQGESIIDEAEKEQFKNIESNVNISEKQVNDAAAQLAESDIKQQEIGEQLSLFGKTEKIAEEISEKVSSINTEKYSDTIKELTEEHKLDKRRIKELEDELKKVKKALESFKNNSLVSKAKALSERIKELEVQLKNATSKLSLKSKKYTEVNKQITKQAETANDALKSQDADKYKKIISKNKKKLALAAGTVVLASFFRIFQKSRPVVNLDINEQEYERSQGSLYRNLGQYTMNTNIRSLY